MRVDIEYWYYDPTNPWAWNPRYVIPPRCYYLGSYPHLWNLTWNRPDTYVTGMTGEVVEFDWYPTLGEKEYIPLRVLTDEDIAFFYTEAALKIINEQKKWIAFRDGRQKSCREYEYGEPWKQYQRPIQTPTVAAEWPGKKITELTPPTPTAAPTPLPPPGMTRLTLTVELAFTGMETQDGMRLNITIG